MKLTYIVRDTLRELVAPLAGAWIEIDLNQHRVHVIPVAPLAGAWIEIQSTNPSSKRLRVAPLAGAWIEIKYFR